ncbi:MAG: arginase [Alphaproteobacteria bacterium]
MAQSPLSDTPGQHSARGVQTGAPNASPATRFARFDRTAALDLHLARFETGQPRTGVGRGPDTLLNAGLMADLAARGLTPRIASDQGPDSAGADTIAQAHAALTQSLTESLCRGARVLTLGGDHSIAFSTIEATLRVYPDVRILYIDAHADVNTASSSPTGNTHGMPIAAHLGLMPAADLPAAAGVSALLQPDRLAYLGLRDVDAPEQAVLDSLGIFHLSTAEMRAMGAGLAVQTALARLDPERQHPVHVSFDIDVTDPALAPSTGVPVPGGASLEDLGAMAAALRVSGRVAAVDVVEVNPALPDDSARSDGPQRTAETALHFLRYLLVNGTR